MDSFNNLLSIIFKGFRCQKIDKVTVSSAQLPINSPRFCYPDG